MTTQIAFLPHEPKNPGPPTLAEINGAFISLDGAFIDVTAAFNQAREGMELLGTTAYETSLSFTVQYPTTSREHRQVQTRLARAFRRPALIHNGRKPPSGCG